MPVAMDTKGRVVVPKELRDRHGLRPGEPLVWHSTEHGLELRPQTSATEALRRLHVVAARLKPSAKSARTAASPEDPLELKHIWEPRP